MAAPALPPTVRIVSGEIQSATATHRFIVPSTGLSAWPPFEQIGETVVSRTRRFPPHAHERQEVLTYVSEGTAEYRVGDRPAETVAPGSAILLSTTERVTHAISPLPGPSVRWFTLVTSLVARIPETRLQTSHRPKTPSYEDTALVRDLLGFSVGMRSAGAVECREVTFVRRSTSFQGVGHDRRAVVYALDGSGTVEGHGLQAGEGALVADTSGIAIGGTPGFRVITATAPLAVPER